MLPLNLLTYLITVNIKIIYLILSHEWIYIYIYMERIFRPKLYIEEYGNDLGSSIFLFK